MKPERKTTKPARPPTEAVGQAKPDWLDCMDEVRDCCHAIKTVSGLLMACGEEELEREVVRGAGDVIDTKVEQIRAALRQMEASR